MNLQHERAKGLRNFLSNRSLNPEIIYFIGEVVVETTCEVSEELEESIESFTKNISRKHMNYRRKGPNWRQWSFPYRSN